MNSAITRACIVETDEGSPTKSREIVCAALHTKCTDAQVRSEYNLTVTNPALIDAAEAGRVTEVSRILDAGTDVDVVGDDGRTALLAALSEGAVACAALLLARGARPHVDAKGLGPLHHAAGSGQRAAMLLAFDLESDINARDNTGCTPLAWAVLLGDDVAQELLLERDADPNRADNDGWTPLHHAAAKGNDAAIKRLLAAGAELTKLPSGHSALDLAMHYARGSQACLLLAAAKYTK